MSVRYEWHDTKYMGIHRARAGSIDEDLEGEAAAEIVLTISTDEVAVITGDLTHFGTRVLAVTRGLGVGDVDAQVEAARVAIEEAIASAESDTADLDDLIGHRDNLIDRLAELIELIDPKGKS